MIVKTPDVCNGAARIDGTCMPVWFIASYINGDEAILTNFPYLNQAQLDAAWEYYDTHKQEIVSDIKAYSYGKSPY